MTEPSTEGPGFVGIRFCQECNNMLYPKEDKVLIFFKLFVNHMLMLVNIHVNVQDNRVLLYACRNCDYRQLADSCCVYVNKIMHEVEIAAYYQSHLTNWSCFGLFYDILVKRNMALWITIPKISDHLCKSHVQKTA